MKWRNLRGSQWRERREKVLKRRQYNGKPRQRRPLALVILPIRIWLKY